MALTVDEQRFYDFAKASLPGWIPDPDEYLMGVAKMFGSVDAMIDYLFGQTLITTAVGPSSDTPDWLNQHAIDRGTRRTNGEDDPTLRERLRTFPDALIRSVLLATADAILAAAGIAGSSAMVELPRDGAHSGTYSSDSGTGGTFVKVGSVVKFTPDTAWAGPPYRSGTIVPVMSHKLTISGAASAGNNGTRTITGLEDDAALITNAGGVAGADPTVSWSVTHYDVDGNLRDGFTRAYSQRGYRSARMQPHTIVIILPYGTTEAVRLSVFEAVRSKKAAGIVLKVERRISPP